VIMIKNISYFRAACGGTSGERSLAIMQGQRGMGLTSWLTLPAWLDHAADGRFLWAWQDRLRVAHGLPAEPNEPTYGARLKIQISKREGEKQSDLDMNN